MTLLLDEILGDFPKWERPPLRVAVHRPVGANHAGLNTVAASG
jgi:hypothetical protein